MRIAIGGFQHETNTFAPNPATLEDFAAADGWPGLTRGAPLFEAVSGINLPIAGFIAAAREARHTLLPLTWCSAAPSGPVTRDAYEHIAHLLLADLQAARPLDAVYLDLHGAMVAEHIDDADAELLRRVRQCVGVDVPVVASLDFHSNTSYAMVNAANALVAYRTYPHVDMADSGDRALRCVAQLHTERWLTRWQALPFLIPLTSQCTLVAPLAQWLPQLSALERGTIRALNFTAGFPCADVADCAPAIFGYGLDAAALATAMGALHAQLMAQEQNFALQVHSIEATLAQLQQLGSVPGAPVILADTQDNPGAGGTCDTTALIKALLVHRVPHVLAGILFDPQAAAQAHAAGVGASVELSLGARGGTAGESSNEGPLQARFEVIALGDGRFTATGPFYCGARMQLGPMALLRIQNLHIAVASRRQQAADQAMFRHLGVEPRQFGVLALKSSVHFRADFAALARQILLVAAPGANLADPAQLPFRKLAPGMRVAGSETALAMAHRNPA
jgi:microcystin degradation protein MlrC